MTPPILTKKKSRHTPGPWKVIPSPHGKKYRCVQYGADGMYTSLEMLPADAKLCAAAPDLLAACQDVLAHESIALCECGEPYCATTKLRAAIKKAGAS